MVAPAARIALALVAVLAWPAVRSSAQGLTVDAVGDALKIRAPGFSFLKGEPLARLKDGRSVRVELTGLVLPGPGKQPAAAARRVFALSYDLWEERFAVTTVEARAQSVSHLALTAAEAWCVGQLAIPLCRARQPWEAISRSGFGSSTTFSMATPRRINRTRATRCRRSSTC